MASVNSSSKPSVPTFEFTKRKRWTETLFSEISETIIFILSPACKVLYCGSAIVELLGWREDQLIDTDLTIFVEDEDQENFRWSFTESLRLGQDMFTYVRFKYDQPPSTNQAAIPALLFEVKGHPHFLPGQQQAQCFFLTAMPYPSRDMALLNTFLDLKIENEKLLQRLHDLKAPIEASRSELSLTSSLTTNSHSQRFNQPSGPQVPNHPSLCPRPASGPPFHTLSNASGSGLGDAQKTSLLRIDDDVPSVNNIGPLEGLSNDGHEDVQRKKLKKTLVGDEQRVCVTCGRTDSPEWRKGPRGPKTLCNACGLRWAKRSRKTEPDASAPSPNPKGQDGGGDTAPGTASGHPLMF